MQQSIRPGDCREVMLDIPDNSIDSVVTDPPYELGFMGKRWDSTGIAYQVEVWQQCLRVLKPGGHLLAFGGTRTYHRMVCAIEDAGFEIRDSIDWVYGSGFPKSMDISKQLDKQAGVTREVVGTKVGTPGYSLSPNKPRETVYSGFKSSKTECEITAPATEQAKTWEGWGTSLKPAHEPIVVARKPLSEKTVASNVLKWGTGGLNIGGCKIGADTIKTCGGDKFPNSGVIYGGWAECEESTHVGRFPANLILEEGYPVELIDEQSGFSKSVPSKANTEKSNANVTVYRLGFFNKSGVHFGDSGGASRYFLTIPYEPFFYCPKTSTKERNQGCNSLPLKEAGCYGEYAGDGRGRQTEHTPMRNNHPTVKPVKLMAYLCRLVTPPNGTVLDPFMGSGSTGMGCVKEGFSFIGIDLDQDYCELARCRIANAKNTC